MLDVWHGVEAPDDHVYRSARAPIMARRREWFERMAEAHAVLWWVPEGHRPTPFEAAGRLDTLRREGPSAAAFTFKRPWPMPGAHGATEDAAAGLDELRATR